jgi:GNAT superfamily N-acetyltransferase
MTTKRSFHISQATLGDIPALSSLLAELFSMEAEFQPDEAAQVRGLALIISDPKVGKVLVARSENEVVGMVNLLFTVSTALGCRVALLEDMVVCPRYRGSGVGSELLKRAIDLVRLEGCGRITLLTDETNESAQRFYRKQGFERSTMVPMRLFL